ncbi:MAG TPA: hypothetical protein VHO91_08775, partial [Rhodopila sp.]|nr:hypothetical protein [Rhodopila sp.]
RHFIFRMNNVGLALPWRCLPGCGDRQQPALSDIQNFQSPPHKMIFHPCDCHDFDGHAGQYNPILR